MPTLYKPQRSTVVILAIALVLRLLVLRSVLVSFPPGWLFTRGMEMGWLANSLLAGQGLASPFGSPTGPTAFVAPGYPLLIAGIFKLFGSNTATSAVVIITLQILLNLVTVWLMMHIARRLWNQPTAIVAGAIWACSPPLLWMPTIFWDTCLAICLLTGLVALVLEFRNRMTPARWLLLGAYCGVTALINPAMLPILAALMGWLIFQQRSNYMRAFLLTSLTAILVFSPWPIRNARVFRAFIPLRTTVGFELWMGNRPGATGFLDESLFPAFNAQELQDYKMRGELNYTANKSALAKQYIVSHPAIFLKLTAVRFTRYWLGSGAQNGSALFILHAAFTTLFGLTGLALLIRHERYAMATLFALPLLLFPIPYYITHAEFRYRLALDTLLTLLAAHALVAILAKLQTRAQPDPKPAEVHA